MATIGDMEQRTCPICGRTFPVAPRRDTSPFCSAQCKMVDLGNWLDGRYRIDAHEEEVFTESGGRVESVEADDPAGEEGSER